MAALEERRRRGLNGFPESCTGLEGYELARRVHNGMIDKHPSLIARCRGVADIVAAVNYARGTNAEISIRGGGHNVAGRAVTEGGVMIDLSLMRGIYVDPAGRRARAQGGVTWGEFNRETQLHGLAVTGGTISTTGIAGLTLGGGLGWLMGKYGIAADNLISAEVVTARGAVLTASESENAGPVLGPARWWRQLRRGQFVRIPPLPGRAAHHRRPRDPSFFACRGGTAPSSATSLPRRRTSWA